MYRDNPHDNPYYGGGGSWDTPPAELRLWYKPGHEAEAKMYAKFEYVGLRDGDVIDAAAYLIDYGAWSTTAVKRCKRTLCASG